LIFPELVNFTDYLTLYQSEMRFTKPSISFLTGKMVFSGIHLAIITFVLQFLLIF
jgi:hypothetical protein